MNTCSQAVAAHQGSAAPAAHQGSKAVRAAAKRVSSTSQLLAQPAAAPQNQAHHRQRPAPHLRPVALLPASSCTAVRKAAAGHGEEGSGHSGRSAGARSSS